MTKITVICNHCDLECTWYENMLQTETTFKKVGEKWYCRDCINKIAQYFVEHALYDM